MLIIVVLALVYFSYKKKENLYFVPAITAGRDAVEVNTNLILPKCYPKVSFFKSNRVVNKSKFTFTPITNIITELNTSNYLRLNKSELQRPDYMAEVNKILDNTTKYKVSGALAKLNNPGNINCFIYSNLMEISNNSLNTKLNDNLVGKPNKTRFDCLWSHSSSNIMGKDDPIKPLFADGSALTVDNRILSPEIDKNEYNTIKSKYDLGTYGTLKDKTDASNYYNKYNTNTLIDSQYKINYVINNNNRCTEQDKIIVNGRKQDVEMRHIIILTLKTIRDWIINTQCKDCQNLVFLEFGYPTNICTESRSALFMFVLDRNGLWYGNFNGLYGRYDNDEGDLGNNNIIAEMFMGDTYLKRINKVFDKNTKAIFQPYSTFYPLFVDSKNKKIVEFNHHRLYYINVDQPTYQLT